MEVLIFRAEKPHSKYELIEARRELRQARAKLDAAVQEIAKMPDGGESYVTANVERAFEAVWQAKERVRQLQKLPYFL